MQNKEKIAIGFDLGTTSVGWSIISYPENDKRKCKLINRGVRLFDQLQSENQERRLARSSRRRISRKNYRQYTLMKFLIKNNICKDEHEYANFICNQPNNKMPFEVKIDALNTKVSNHELTYILNSYIKRRGSFIEESYGEKYEKLLNKRDELMLELSQYSQEEKSDKNLLKEYKKKQKNLEKCWKDLEAEKNRIVFDYNSNILPCYNQLNWWNKYNKVNFNRNLNFKNNDYKKELKEILLKQNLEQLYEQLVQIFWTKREYWEGPGSEISYSKWGRFDENGIKKYEKLWEKNIGSCSWFINEKRTFKNSPKYILFNIINKLSVLNFEHKTQRYCLSKKLIKDFLFNYFNQKNINKKMNMNKLFSYFSEKNLLEKIFSDVHFEEIRDKKEWFNALIIKGIKKDDDKENLKLSLFDVQNLKIMINYFCLKNNIDHYELNNQNINKLNELYIELVNSKDEEDFGKMTKFINDDQLLQILKNFWEKETKQMQPGKLSEKAISYYLNYFFESKFDNEKMPEQQTFYIENIVNTNLIENNEFKGKKYFPNNYFKDEIIPPNVKRIFQQAINVYNAILKRYVYNNKNSYDLEYVTIELARELNDSNKKDRIKENQKNNEKFIENFKDIFPNEYRILNNSIKNINKKFIKKLKLWCEQNGKDVYKLNSSKTDFEKIDIKDLDSYEIEHIFPEKKTKDSRISNLVITHQMINNEKGNRTPFEFLDDFDKFKELWTKNYLEIKPRLLVFSQSDKKEKLNRLTFEGKADQISSHFLTNALNDTRHVTSLFMNKIKEFNSTSNNILNKVKVVAVNGLITNSLKFLSFYEELKKSNLLYKDRLTNEHHSIDATICAIIGKEKWVLDQENSKFKNNNVDKNGEYSNIHSNFLHKHYSNILNSLNNIKCKFSRMKIKKQNNQKLFDIKQKSVQLINEKEFNGWFKISKKKIFDYEKIEEFENDLDLLLADNKLKNSITQIIDNHIKPLHKKHKILFMNYCLNSETKKIMKKIFEIDDEKWNDNEWEQFYLNVGVPILKQEDNNFKVITYVKELKKRDKKETNINSLFIINKNIFSDSRNNQNLNSVINKFNKNNRTNKNFELTNSKKCSYYENLIWKTILLHKNGSFKYITAKNMLWNYKRNKLNINISSIIDFLDEKNNLLCKNHQNLILSELNEFICDECESKIISNSDKNVCALTKGTIVYLDNENVGKEKLIDELKQRKIKWENVYFITGGSQSEENIEFHPISRIELTKKYINSKNQLINYKEKSSDIHEKNRIENKIQNLAIEKHRNRLSLDSFIKKTVCILDIDVLGNYKINKSIFFDK